MSVETASVACNHCGAALDIAEDTRFVTCTYCETKLQVRREKGARFTEVQRAVEKLEKRAEKIEGDVGILKLEGELARVERDWERDRIPLMHQSKNGRLSAPNRATALFAPVASTVMAIVIALQADEYVVGALVVLGGVVLGLWQHSSAMRYEHAHAAYVERREAVEAKLRKARKKERASQD